MRKIRKILVKLILLWVVFIVLSLAVPPLFHKSYDGKNQKTEALYESNQENNQENKHGSSLKSNLQNQERVLSIDNNMDALLWRLRLIEAAREKIIFTTFDLRDDQSGCEVMAALWNAAQRGVKIQILIDGINGQLRLDNSEYFRELAAHENVEAKFYNPITLIKPWMNNYRMHDKYLIADDFAYILGGRNTNDLFLGNYSDSCNEDRDILVYETVPGEGNSYKKLQEYFVQIWDLPCCVGFDKQWNGEKKLKDRYQEVQWNSPEVFKKTDWEKVTMETSGIDLWTNPVEPENKEPLLWKKMVNVMKKEKDLVIQTPYIISDKMIYQDLTEICASAEKVDLMINAVESGTNPFGCTDYLNQKENIRKTGVTVYEYLGEYAQHTKTILAGENISMVGSCNLDMRSIYLDTEMMLVIDSPKLNASIRDQIGVLKEKSRQISPDGTVTDGEQYEPEEQSTQKKLFYGVLRILTVPFRQLL